MGTRFTNNRVNEAVLLILFNLEKHLPFHVTVNVYYYLIIRISTCYYSRLVAKKIGRSGSSGFVFHVFFNLAFCLVISLYTDVSTT